MNRGLSLAGPPPPLHSPPPRRPEAPGPFSPGTQAESPPGRFLYTVGIKIHKYPRTEDTPGYTEHLHCYLRIEVILKAQTHFHHFHLHAGG